MGLYVIASFKVAMNNGFIKRKQKPMFLVKSMQIFYRFQTKRNPTESKHFFCIKNWKAKHKSGQTATSRDASYQLIHSGIFVFVSLVSFSIKPDCATTHHRVWTHNCQGNRHVLTNPGFEPMSPFAGEIVLLNNSNWALMKFRKYWWERCH